MLGIDQKLCREPSLESVLAVEVLETELDPEWSRSRLAVRVGVWVKVEVRPYALQVMDQVVFVLDGVLEPRRPPRHPCYSSQGACCDTLLAGGRLPSPMFA